MEPLIKLRLSMDKLDHYEWIQFKSQWMALLDRNTISSLIYHYFHHHKPKNTNYNFEIVMTSVENIIKSRPETTQNHSKSISSLIEQSNSLSSHHSDQSQSYSIKLNELPTDLIGDIASYLDQTNYAKFELLCRQTYISCNNPSTLHTLDLLNVAVIDYNIKHKYSLIKGLYVSVPHFAEYMETNTNPFPFNRLTTLRLSQVVSLFVLNHFTQHNNFINFASITHLTCDYFINIVDGDGVFEEFDVYVLYRFLSHFSALEELRLIQVFTQNRQNDDDDDIIGGLLPNLRRFSAMNCSPELVNKIINLYGHKLEVLMLLNQDCSLIHSNRGFPLLSQLSVVAPSVAVINRILTNTAHLKRFGMGMQQNQNMTQMEFQQLMVHLLQTQYLLEYVGLDVSYNDFGLFMDAIKKALSNVWHVHKHEFKLGIHVHFCNENVIKKAKFYISKVMHKLRRSNIANYMVFVRFIVDDGYEYQESIVQRNKMMKTLNQTYLAFYERCMNPRHEFFVISNENCTINGYSSGWQPLL